MCVKKDNMRDGWPLTKLGSQEPASKLSWAHISVVHHVNHFKRRDSTRLLNSQIKLWPCFSNVLTILETKRLSPEPWTRRNLKLNLRIDSCNLILSQAGYLISSLNPLKQLKPISLEEGTWPKPKVKGKTTIVKWTGQATHTEMEKLQFCWKEDRAFSLLSTLHLCKFLLWQQGEVQMFTSLFSDNHICLFGIQRLQTFLLIPSGMGIAWRDWQYIPNGKHLNRFPFKVNLFSDSMNAIYQERPTAQYAGCA